MFKFRYFEFSKLINFFLIFVCIACFERYEYEHHVNGNIKIKAETNDGVKHGLLRQYYENGELESVQHWINGKLNGEFADYYSGNSISRKGMYRENKRYGEWIYYNKDGTIFQIQSYDASGHILDVKRFLPGGERDLKPFPYIYINSPEVSDTLTLGNKHTLYIKIVNISDSLISADDLILTDTLSQNKFGVTVADTIAIIRPNDQHLYRYDFIPTREGDDSFVGLIYCKRIEGRYMDVISLGFRYPFFVRKGEGRANVHRVVFSY